MNNSANDRISMSIATTTTTGLSIDTDSLATASQAQAAITALDTALATVNTERRLSWCNAEPSSNDDQ